MKRTIRGMVVGPDGKPAKRATVFWIGLRNRIPKVPIPLDHDSRWASRTEVLAEADRQ